MKCVEQWTADFSEEGVRRGRQRSHARGFWAVNVLA